MPSADIAATPYAALNAVLGHFVSGVRELLADNLVGIYLQGSFAVGDFDEHSDVDFVVAVRHDIPNMHLPALNALHAAIHEFPEPWGHRLEGSYFPAPILRRWSNEPRDPPGAPPRPAAWVDPETGDTPPTVYPLLFLNHGAKSVVRSEHDNTRVVRWVTREKGIALAGPNPRELIDEVSADALRGEMHRTMVRWAATFLSDPSAIKQLWHQGLIVVSYCRMLHSLQTGMVASKKASAEWAMSMLDVRWRPLIAASLRARPSQSLGPADPQAVAETVAFVEHVMQRRKTP
jgi:hypothetical protein